MFTGILTPAHRFPPSCLCECQELSFKHIAECITQRSDGIVRRTSQQVKILLYNHFHYLQDRIEEVRLFRGVVVCRVGGDLG